MNANEPAFPTNSMTGPDSEGGTVFIEGFRGLTKREHFAIEALKALLNTPYRSMGPQMLGNYAAQHADCLLQSLEK